MKTVITIGHQDFVLGPKASAAALVKALEGAVEVKWDYARAGSGEEREFFIGQAIEIKISQVPESRFKVKMPDGSTQRFEEPRRINGARKLRQLEWRKA